ncbi:MAG: hypothetical protein E7812_00140 [Phenylobacterium sp.]|nr:MAG: hypothetical protein E7812_00140 [Phenylobacterium sp.]
MDFDIRIPIGLLFVCLGLLLGVYGLVGDPAIYRAHSLGVNVNLAWGLVLLLFGAANLALAVLLKPRP